jgi:hypothetical protein
VDLPVREIAEVIFADFFRQIFARVRFQAFPFSIWYCSREFKSSRVKTSIRLAEWPRAV